MSNPKSQSVLEIAVGRVGVKIGVKALTFALKWGIWTESDDPDAWSGRVVDFARWALMSPAKAYGQLEAFRSAFPEFEYPDALWASASKNVDRAAAERVQFARFAVAQVVLP